MAGIACSACGKDGAKMQCSKCRKAVYCSRECQRREWPMHKLACEEAQGKEAVRREQSAQGEAALHLFDQLVKEKFMQRMKVLIDISRSQGLGVNIHIENLMFWPSSIRKHRSFMMSMYMKMRSTLTGKYCEVRQGQLRCTPLWPTQFPSNVILRSHILQHVCGPQDDVEFKTYQELVFFGIYNQLVQIQKHARTDACSAENGVKDIILSSTLSSDEHKLARHIKFLRGHVKLASSLEDALSDTLAVEVQKVASSAFMDDSLSFERILLCTLLVDLFVKGSLRPRAVSTKRFRCSPLQA